jgi:hypothetical protein
MTHFTEGDLAKLGLVRQPDGSYKKGQVYQSPSPKPVKKNREQNQNEIYLEKLSDDPNDIILQWADKSISLNKWYSSEHWTKRTAAKKEWKEFFFNLFPKPLPTIDKYFLTLKYNSRLDPSNAIAMVKLCEDTMQEFKMLQNDNKNFCRGISLIPDETMKGNTYKIIIKSL